jgi:hypothetical protein
MRAVHVFDLCAHGLVSVLLVVLSRRSLGLDAVVSGAIGLLFAVHPVHVEAVCNCTSRAEMMYSLAVLLALMAFFESDRLLSGAPLHRLGQLPAAPPTRWTWVVLPALWVCQGVACACKEQGIFFVCMSTAFLGMQLLVLWRAPPPGTRGRVTPPSASASASTASSSSPSSSSTGLLVVLLHVVLWACTSANILWRWYVSGTRLVPSYSYTMNPLPYLNSTQAKVLTALSYHVESFRLMLLPTVQPMRCDYKDLPSIVDVGDPRNAWAALLYTALLLLASVLACGIWRRAGLPALAPPRPGAAAPPPQQPSRRLAQQSGDNDDHRRHHPLLLPAVTFFGILVTFYLPSSNAVGYVGFYVAERVLYLPSAGVIGLGCLALHWLVHAALANVQGASPPSGATIQPATAVAAPTTTTTSTTTRPPAASSSAAARWVFIVICGAVAGVLGAATVERVPAWVSTAQLWATDFANYPLNPTMAGSHATQTYIDHPRDRALLLAAVELVVDSAGIVSDAQSTTDHVTRIAERLAQLGAAKVAVRALERAIEQNDAIMRQSADDLLTKGLIRVDPRWTRNRPGYPHVQNCNYLRSKGLCLMMGSGDGASSNEEFPTSEERLAAKHEALAAFEAAVAMCREMRRTASWEQYPSTTDQETVGVIMMASRAARELGQEDKARRYLEECVAVAKSNRRMLNGPEQQRCEQLLAQL